MKLFEKHSPVFLLTCGVPDLKLDFFLIWNRYKLDLKIWSYASNLRFNEGVVTITENLDDKSIICSTLLHTYQWRLSNRRITQHYKFEEMIKRPGIIYLGCVPRCRTWFAAEATHPECPRVTTKIKLKKKTKKSPSVYFSINTRTIVRT